MITSFLKICIDVVIFESSTTEAISDTKTLRIQTNKLEKLETLRAYCTKLKMLRKMSVTAGNVNKLILYVCERK